MGLLSRRKLAHLMRNQTVPTTSYTRLVKGIATLGFLKLDVEGGEGVILRDVVDSCIARNLCPTYIKYERIHMPKSHRSEAKRALGILNYTLLESCSDPGGAPVPGTAASQKPPKLRQRLERTRPPPGSPLRRLLVSHCGSFRTRPVSPVAP